MRYEIGPQGRATERQAGLPMAQKHTWPRQKVTVKITQAQADLILENDCIDQEVLDSLDFSEPHAGIVASGQKTTQANFKIKTTALTATAAQPSAGSRSTRSTRSKRPALDRGRLSRDRGQAFLIF